MSQKWRVAGLTRFVCHRLQICLGNAPAVHIPGRAHPFEVTYFCATLARNTPGARRPRLSDATPPKGRGHVCVFLSSEEQSEAAAYEQDQNTQYAQAPAPQPVAPAAPAAAGGAGGATLVDEIQRLATLDQQGALTDAEFEAAKQRLLV